MADDYPWGQPEDTLAEGMKQLAEMWGTDAPVELLVPSMVGNLAFRRWYAKTSRAAVSPATPPTTSRWAPPDAGLMQATGGPDVRP